MTDLELEIQSIENKIEELKKKRIELLNKLPKQEYHPDTFEKPFFVIVPTEVPENPYMEQLYDSEGLPFTIDGEHVRLVLRTSEMIDILTLEIPMEICDLMRGNWAYDSKDYKCMNDDEIQHFLGMSKVYRDYVKK